MKITKRQLQRIIKEEISHLMERGLCSESDERQAVDPFEGLADAQLSPPIREKSNSDVSMKLYMPVITEAMILAALKAAAVLLGTPIVTKIYSMIVDKGIEEATRYMALKIFEKHLARALGQDMEELSAKGWFFPSTDRLKSDPALVSQLSQPQVGEYRTKVSDKIMYEADKPFKVDVNAILNDFIQADDEDIEVDVEEVEIPEPAEEIEAITENVNRWSRLAGLLK